jgi:protein-S-isoprenylcysteine O-methyltransferase Ste14
MSNQISFIFFFTALTGELLVILILIAGILNSKNRIWPPTAEHPRGKWIMSGIFLLISFTLILLGVTDWTQAIFPGWMRLMGAVIWLFGLSLSFRAMDMIGKQATFGLVNKLIERGPYRYSRNPQYLGFMISLVGWGIFISSIPLMIACGGAIIPLLIVPYLEETWLEEHYGDIYRTYKYRVPRWFNFKLRNNHQ